MITASTQRELFRLQRESIAAEIKEKDEHGKPRWTYAEIGDRRSISRERVRQIAKMFGIERRRKQEPNQAQEGE